ncbi:small hydrophilic protein [Streptomyces sp. NPDC056049]|uniref:small hydrophilic protein n=1 Tax=Streptomyces sp. NPDC056049 TaxID=3345693 RepID=UPI0035E12D78
MSFTHRMAGLVAVVAVPLGIAATSYALTDEPAAPRVPPAVHLPTTPPPSGSATPPPTGTAPTAPTSPPTPSAPSASSAGSTPPPSDSVVPGPSTTGDDDDDDHE